MAKIDPEQERKRLAEFYLGQLDGELEKVASEAYELSDLAREVLSVELAKRGLIVQLAEHAPVTAKPAPMPGDPPTEEEPAEMEVPTQDVPAYSSNGDVRDPVMIRKFRDLPEALLAKGSLESAGIECTLADDNMVRMDWFYSNAIGGIKLLVAAEDAAEAEQVLSQPIPERFDVPDIGAFDQPKCPKCGSLDVSFRELQASAYLSMALNVPIPFQKRAWRCHSCDTEWEDDGDLGTTESSA
ncbi:MAG TPA: DUF2007 domain-containing protein [Candidatus Sulfotelmatobacter sp.]|nr:DUF2007 domain-containing protein [Candidatus Sulfotelmatobacter sp.]